MTENPVRYDRTLCLVIGADALLSAASPVLVAVLPMTGIGAVALGLAAIACALVLAGLGAMTAVLFALRMRAGHGHVPAGLRLPLPAAMRPDLSRPAR